MHFKWVNHMVCKLHFNKAVIKNNKKSLNTNNKLGKILATYITNKERIPYYFNNS